VHASDIRAAAALILAVSSPKARRRSRDSSTWTAVTTTSSNAFATSALTSNGSRDLLGSRRIGGAGPRGFAHALARLLTFVESGDRHSWRPRRWPIARRRPTSWGHRPPGAGKSTLTDQLINVVLDRGSFGGADDFDQVSVLCVDPSSPFTGGAILGDRIRMQGHATNEHVFIRSMATRGHLGGLSLAVPDAVRVLGAANFRLSSSKPSASDRWRSRSRRRRHDDRRR